MTHRQIIRIQVAQLKIKRLMKEIKQLKQENTQLKESIKHADKKENEK